MSKFYIVWNESRNEGFITDDSDDADTALNGRGGKFAVSTAAEAFNDIYGDDPCTLEEVEL